MDLTSRFRQLQKRSSKSGQAEVVADRLLSIGPLRIEVSADLSDEDLSHLRALLETPGWKILVDKIWSPLAAEHLVGLAAGDEANLLAHRNQYQGFMKAVISAEESIRRAVQEKRKTAPSYSGIRRRA